MEQRRFGHSGQTVSAIGLGGMSFSDFYGATTQAESFAVMDAARDLGIDHIDTSNIYGMGRSEEAIGAYIKAVGANPFTIATKAGITRDASGNRIFDNSPAHLRSELEGSLNRLGLERVDLFYVHRRDPSVPIEEVTGTLAELKQEGKIGAFGFSEIAPYSLRQACLEHPVDAVQNEYSLATRLPDLGLVQECARQGTTLVAFSPVGRGYLSDTPPTPESIAQSAFLAGNPRFTPEALALNLRATDRFRALAAEMGLPAAGLAMAWLLAQSSQVVPIPGTRSVTHLRELATGGSVRLSTSDLDRVEAALPVGWAAGDRYNVAQNTGPERYC